LFGKTTQSFVFSIKGQESTKVKGNQYITLVHKMEYAIPATFGTFYNVGKTAKSRVPALPEYNIRCLAAKGYHG